MRFGHPRRAAMPAALAAGALALSACSAGSLGSDDEGAGGKTQITFLTNNDPANVETAEAVIAAFEEANTDVDVELDTRPQGGEGDNLVKTRLSTGDMADVFEYNSGSLFQAISPRRNLTPVTDEAWVGDLDEVFTSVVSAGDDVYGAPWGNITGGGIFYHIPTYERLGLEVPTTWEEFIANSDEIKADGGTAVEQTYGDTWTSQIFVLADFHNVAAAVPSFVEDYTANQAKYATTPAALAGFEHLQEVHDKGYLNEDFASAKLNDGLTAVANGDAAHYPTISFATNALAGVAGDKIDDVGFFAIPGEDAAQNGATVWEPSGLYIPTTTQGAELEAAKKFLAFMASPDGCAAYTSVAPPGGPFAVTTCELPAEVPQVVKDVAAYNDKGAASPALEFLSPIKGPALEQITVEVGSGITPAKRGAELYDEDVEKQAQQLGLEGW